MKGTEVSNGGGGSRGRMFEGKEGTADLREILQRKGKHGRAGHSRDTEGDCGD